MSTRVSELLLVEEVLPLGRVQLRCDLGLVAVPRELQAPLLRGDVARGIPQAGLQRAHLYVRRRDLRVQQDDDVAVQSALSVLSRGALCRSL